METPFTVTPCKVRAEVPMWFHPLSDGPLHAWPEIHRWSTAYLAELCLCACLQLLLFSQDPADTSCPTTPFPSPIPPYRDFPSNSALWGSVRNGVDGTKLQAFPVIEVLRGIFLWISPSLSMQAYQHDNIYLGAHIVSCYRKGVYTVGVLNVRGQRWQPHLPKQQPLCSHFSPVFSQASHIHSGRCTRGKSHVVRKSHVYPEWQADVSNNAALLGCGSLQQGKRSLTVNSNATCSQGNFSRSFNANKQKPTAKLNAADSLATTVKAVGLGIRLFPGMLKVWKN